MTRMESRSEEEQILRDGFRTEGVASPATSCVLTWESPCEPGRRPAVRHGEVFSSKRADRTEPGWGRGRLDFPPPLVLCISNDTQTHRPVGFVEHRLSESTSSIPDASTLVSRDRHSAARDLERQRQTEAMPCVWVVNIPSGSSNLRQSASRSRRSLQNERSSFTSSSSTCCRVGRRCHAGRQRLLS